MWIVLSINYSRCHSWQVSVLFWSIKLRISYVSLKSDNITCVEMSYVLALTILDEKTRKAYSFRVQSGKIPVWIQNTATCQFSSGPTANLSRLLLRTHKVSKDTCTMPKIENSKKATRIIWRILPVFYDVSNAIVKVFFLITYQNFLERVRIAGN